MRDFNSLSQKEIIALAIALEEEDERIYSDFGETLRENFPGTAQVSRRCARKKLAIAGIDRALSAEIRRAYSAHPPPGRSRLCAAQAYLAEHPAAAGADSRASGHHGSRDAPLLLARRGARAGRQHPPVARRSGRGREARTWSAPRTGEDRTEARSVAKKKTKPSGGCSCCRSCSPAWRA